MNRPYHNVFEHDDPVHVIGITTKASEATCSYADAQANHSSATNRPASFARTTPVHNITQDAQPT